MESVADEVKDVHYRIGKDAEFALYFIAALFDLLSFVLDILGIVLSVVGIGVVLVGINSLVGMFGELILAFLFFLKGVSPFSQKIALRYVGVFILKILPFIGGLVPAMIWTVMIVVFWSREEDKHPAIRAAEAAAAKAAFAKSGGPEGDAKAVDNRAAALARSRGGDQGKELSKDLRGNAGANQASFGERNRQGAERQSGGFGNAGRRAEDVGTSAITRGDLAQEERMQRKQGVPQNFDGIQAPQDAGDSDAA